MARPSRLTKVYVEQVDTPGRFSDGRGGNGLSLRVRRSRDGKTLTKAWEQRVNAGGRVFNLGLGGYETVGIAQARRLASENVQKTKAAHPRRSTLDRYLDGADDSGLGPVGLNAPAPAIAVTAPTFGELAADYLEVQRGRWKAGSKTEKQTRSLLDNYVLAAIGAKPVNTVSSADVTDVLGMVWHSKPPTAQKLARIIRSVMRFAVGKDLALEDPTARAIQGLGRQNHRVKHADAIPYAEVPAALDSIRRSRSFPDKRLALELLILTATRTSEIRGLLRGEVDFDTSTWTIPASRMKGGLEHRIPLSRAAVDLLVKVWDNGSADELVFTSQGFGMLSQDGMRQLLIRRYPEKTPHGFRSSFRDWVSDKTDYPAELAEHALAHLEGSATVRAYARSDMFEKRRMLMEDWAQYVTGAST